MRVYKAWAKQWEGLKSEIAGDVPAATKSRRHVPALLLSFVAIPLPMTLTKDDTAVSQALVVLWALDVVCLARLLLAKLHRTVTGSAAPMKQRGR